MQVPPTNIRKLVATLAIVFASLISGHAQVVVINEFMAQNVNSTVIDEDGEHSDWLELQNNGNSTISLNGWYLTDDAADLRKWRFPVTTPAVNLAAGARLVVYCSNKNRKALANRLHTNFKLDAAGEYLGLIRSDGFTVEHSYGPTYPPQFNNSVYGASITTTAQELLSETATGKAKVPTSLSDFTTNFSGWNSSLTFDTTTWQTGQSGFGYDNTGAGSIGPLVSTTGNVGAMMSGQNSSCFVRYNFNVASPSAVNSLTLKVKYDDGYLCYLNGGLIASVLSSGSPTWNSAAIVDRTDAVAASFETANLSSNAKTFLLAGNNVLAFQMLNYSANDTAALLRPQFSANIISSVQTGYLASATPGSANSAIVTTFGPAISQVTDSPGPITSPVPPAANGSLFITAKVVPTLRPLAATSPVTLKCRVMYNNEVSVPMYDDGPAGNHGDAVAGDTIFTGLITYATAAQAVAPQPTVIITPGQMLRWRIEARDNATTPVYSYEPAYTFSLTVPPTNPPPVVDTTDLDQYFGTIAVNPAVDTSRVPVLHWFTNDAANTRTTTGASCSFYYLDQFYDNVRAEIHGQSTASFPVNKKSHNLNFTKINRFKWKAGEPRVRSVNLLTNYADKTKLRSQLAWEAWSLSGHIMSHWAQQVRVEQNGAFWGLYDMVEDGNEDMLDRFGYNSYDALYKIYDRMLSSASAEQKTREDVDTSKTDYQAMLNGLAYENPDVIQTLTQRRAYAYDNVNIASVVNGLAVHALINNNDWGHKNFYMFRNTNGTGEWALIPWDQDLSSGHTWVSAQSYFNDEIDSQRAIRNGAENRLKKVIYDSPELNKMFVRRMRTLMDEVFVSSTSTTGWYETRIPQLLNLLDPTDLGVGIKSDQQLDFEKWGFWVHGSSASIAYTDSRAVDHTLRVQAGRLTTSNAPPQTVLSTGSPQLSNTTWTFLEGRRRYLYNMDAQNPASGTDLIPTSQPAVPTGITIEAVEFNPASGNVNQENFVIKNQSGAEVDVSGWHVTGLGGSIADAVDYTFQGGTVISNFTSGSAVNATGDVHIGRLHVARNPAAFRARTVSPKGGEYRLVAGPYNGRLSARGGTIELRNKSNQLVASTTWTPAPTAAQTALRITELNYDPAPPTVSETTDIPGLTSGDFEFIELMNTGATSLTLTGAQFDKGITFIFPTFTLAAGQRCLVVRSLAAFQKRYGTGFSIAGEFEGGLDNSGETLRLLDPAGEEVFEFTYSGLWYPQADGGGYTLVTRVNNTAYDGFDTPLAWAISGTVNGTPGTTDSNGFSQSFESWRYDHFTPTELLEDVITTPDADADGDGSTNFYEYAFGSDPRDSNSNFRPAVTSTNVTGSDYPTIKFIRRKKEIDLTYIVESSNDLGGIDPWTVVDLPVGAPVSINSDLEEVTYRDNQPMTGPKRFLRVRAVK